MHRTKQVTAIAALARKKPVVVSHRINELSVMKNVSIQIC